MELTNEDLMGLDAQTSKDEDRLEEGVTEEPKRFTTRGVSLLEEALLVFEAQEPNVEQYTKAVAAVQNTVQCYGVIHDEEKKSHHTDITGSFFRRVDRIESSKEPEPSGVSEIAACPLSSIADNPSALPSLTSSPPCSQ